MTSRESATRRALLGTLAAALGVTSGCGTRTETGRNDGTTPATTQTSAPAETTVLPTATDTVRQTQTPDTETDTPARDAETDTPTPDTETDTSTPALNQTGYEVTRLLGPEDDRIDRLFQRSLLDSGEVRVQLITSRQAWQTVRRMIERKVNASYRGLPFVTETVFSAESLVAVWVDMANTDRVRLVGVSREGTRTVRLRVEAAGNFGAQVRIGRILLVRVPNGRRLTRAVVEYINDEGELTVVTDERGDESGTETATQDTERQRVWPIRDH